MEYIHETIQVHASHWDDVSWTRKTTLAFFIFELSSLDLVSYSKLCPGLNNNFMVYLLQLHINPFSEWHFGGGIRVLWTLFLVFEFNFLSLFCYTNTLPNMLMVLGTNVEQDVLTCCIQDDSWWDCRGWGGGIFVFFSKKPFLVISSFWHAPAISVYVCIVTDTYIYLPPVCGYMFSRRITKEK